MNILITGMPGSGKTTLIKKVAALITGAKNGFYTEEIRDRGRRTGFSLETFSGEKAVLSSVSIKSPCRVGKYGVDVATFERVGVTAVEEAVEENGVIIIDEIGKMELFSPAFKEAVVRALDTERVIATIKSSKDGFTTKIKQRKDVKIIAINQANRDELAENIIRMLDEGEESVYGS
ncbi:MAG: NTPase [Candidatus Omnitrophota bacterium]|jgi:nucleoside-triphosphatase THEP1